MKPLPVLDKIAGPADLHGLTTDELTQLADDIRYRIKETVSASGGHLASNLGVVELTIALHRSFDFTRDRLLFDVGHQAYPHKLLTGRAGTFNSNRQAGGLSGFPDPKESVFDVAKVGHSSTAISTGVGLAEGHRLVGGGERTVVMVGDGALTGGMSFEGLINAGDRKCPLLVVLNDNGSFIDPPTGALHHYLDKVRSGRIYNKLRQRFIQLVKRMGVEKMAETAEAVALKMFAPGYIFEDLGFRYFGPIDGHDRSQLEVMLEHVRRIDTPVLLHVHTRKGGGWKPAEGDPLTYHAGKNFDLDTGAFQPAPPARATYSDVFAEGMIELGEEDPGLVGITAAMPSGTGLRKFGQVFPDRLYDVGICEQHSFGFAQGMAVAGRHPVLAHYSTFAQRGFDQLFQELVVQRDLGVVVTLDRAGMVGEDGETHQGLYDIAWSRTLPGTVLMAPKDGPELKAMLRWSHEERLGDDRAAAYLIRYPKEAVPELTWGLERPNPIERGRAEVLKLGHGVMVWAYGPMVARAWEAIEELGKDITLVNARFAKPFDDDLLATLAADHHTVLTLEDHALSGGFGSVVSEAVHDRGLACMVRRLGVRDELVPHATRAQQLAEHGLDVAGILAVLRELTAADDINTDEKIIRLPGRA